MSAALYKMTEVIPSTSAHLIDRSEDVVLFELLWVIKWSILSFPVYLLLKKFLICNRLSCISTITRQHSTRHCRLKLRGQLGWNGSAPISTVLLKSVGFFIINIFLKVKKLPKLKSGKWWTRLAWYPLQYGNWWNNPSSEENGTGQYPETQETGLKGRSWKP